MLEIEKVLVVIDEHVLGVILALSAAFCWGFSSVLYKAGIDSESIFISLIIRSTSGVLFIALITFFINQFKEILELFSQRIFLIMLFSCIFLLIAEILFFQALQSGDVSTIQPIASIYPLFAAIFVLLVGIEDFSAIVLIGTMIIVIGVLIVSQQTQNKRMDTSKSEQLKHGVILAILAAVFWGLAILTVQIILEEEIDVYSFAVLRFTIFAVLTAGLWLSVSLYNNRNDEKIWTLPISRISKRNSIIIASSGIIGFGMGALCFFQSINLIGALRATPISSINPLIAALFGIVLLKEKITHFQAFGIVLVVIGSIIISIS